MGLDTMMASTLMTGVAVRANPGAVARVLEGAGLSGWVLAMDGGWSRVQVEGEAAPSVRQIESDALLAEALAAMEPGGEVPAPMGYDTPVRLARWLSRTLGGEAVGVWASDQDPGIGGMVRFDAGARSHYLSAASPEGVRLIDELRQAEVDGESPEDEESLWDALDETAWSVTWTADGVKDGPVGEHAQEACRGWELDPDCFDEGLDGTRPGAVRVG